MRTTKTQSIMLSRMKLISGPYGIRTRLNLLSDSQVSTPKSRPRDHKKLKFLQVIHELQFNTFS